MKRTEIRTSALLFIHIKHDKTFDGQDNTYSFSVVDSAIRIFINNIQLMTQRGEKLHRMGKMQRVTN
jgi:hypothetical protein